MKIEQIVSEVKQMNAEDIETLVAALIDIADEAAELSDDRAWSSASKHLVMARAMIASRSGN